MHRSPERQIGLICAWSSAKIAKRLTAPNGGSRMPQLEALITLGNQVGRTEV
jgi:hypothetical protein